MGTDEQDLGLLRVDPLAEAERLTGRSYKEDGATMALGLLEGMALAEAQRKML